MNKLPTFQFEDLDEEFFKSARPYIIENIPICKDQSFNKSPNPNKLAYLLSNRSKLEISISEDSQFSGDLKNHSVISMTLNEYLEYKGSLRLYLSQVDVKTQFAKLQENLILRLNRLGLEVNRVNVWHSNGTTISQFHYDSYQNFLLVDSGVKVVYLADPNNSKFRSCLEKQNHIKKYSEELLPLCDRLEIGRNTIVFIPEGWWHRVETVGEDNLAFNFWWTGVSGGLDYNEAYLLKLSMERLIEDKIKQIHQLYDARYSCICSLQALKEKISRKGEFLALVESCSRKLSFCAYMYFEFERGKESEEDRVFFSRFWEILKERNLEYRFLRRITTMRKKLARKIIKWNFNI